MKDWRGTEIEVGSVVVYPVSGGGTVSVIEGKVAAIEEYTNPSGPGGVRTKLQVVRLRRASIVGWGDNHYSATNTFDFTPKARDLEPKSVWLDVLERVTVVG